MEPQQTLFKLVLKALGAFKNDETSFVKGSNKNVRSIIVNNYTIFAVFRRVSSSGIVRNTLLGLRIKAFIHGISTQVNRSDMLDLLTTSFAIM